MHIYKYYISLHLLKYVKVFFTVLWNNCVSNMFVVKTTFFDNINTRSGTFFCTLANRHSIIVRWQKFICVIVIRIVTLFCLMNPGRERKFPQSSVSSYPIWSDFLLSDPVDGLLMCWGCEFESNQVSLKCEMWMVKCRILCGSQSAVRSKLFFEKNLLLIFIAIQYSVSTVITKIPIYSAICWSFHVLMF